MEPHRKEPVAMDSMTQVEGPIHLGLDVAKNAIAVPTAEQEAVRDLCRARSALVRDRRRARQRLDKFLLRHDRVYRAGTAWTARYELWLGGQRFDDPALRATYGHYRGVVQARDAELTAIEAALAPWLDRGPFAAATHRL